MSNRRLAQKEARIINNNQYLTMREVADRLGLSEATVRKIIKSGELPASRIGPSGKTVRIAVDDLVTYMESRKIGRQ